MPFPFPHRRCRCRCLGECVQIWGSQHRCLHRCGHHRHRYRCVGRRPRRPNRGARNIDVDIDVAMIDIDADGWARLQHRAPLLFHNAEVEVDVVGGHLGRVSSTSMSTLILPSSMSTPTFGTPFQHRHRCRRTYCRHRCLRHSGLLNNDNDDDNLGSIPRSMLGTRSPHRHRCRPRRCRCRSRPWDAPLTSAPMSSKEASMSMTCWKSPWSRSMGTAMSTSTSITPYRCRWVSL